MKKLIYFLLTLFVIVSPFISCSGGDDDITHQEQNPSSPNIKTIGPNGGTVTSKDGNVKIIIPSGALSSNTKIEIEKSSSPSPVNSDKAVPRGIVYKLSPVGTNFDTPVTI